MVPTSALADWPQYRGPAASGVDATTALPTKWDATKSENVRWQTPIPGMAHAAPITWGDRIYIATVVGKEEAELKVGLYGDIAPANDVGPQQWRLLALDAATGRILWNTLALEAVPRVKRHTKASHCNSTPATDGKHIVAIFGSEGMFCFDLEGKLLWKKDLGPMDSGFFMSPTAQWGFGSSPVIHEGKVIVQCDVQKDSFIAAFDVTDGRELWRTPRTDVPTWGTPAVVEADGVKQIVANGWRESAGYDFATGSKLWTLDGGGDIPVPTPIFSHGLVFLTSAHGKWRPIRGIRPSARGDITPADPGQTNESIAWTHPRRGNYMQTPIAVGDLLFACNDNGVVTCFDAPTGAIRFSERISSGGEGFTASPVSDGKHVYFTSELGNVHVLAATAELKKESVNALGQTFMSTPAIHKGMLLFRTRDRLIAVGESAP
jgi:outer membrane protein assembly factor BamB